MILSLTVFVWLSTLLGVLRGQELRAPNIRRTREIDIMGKWLDRLQADPTTWLLERACAPIQFRLLTEILGRSMDDADVLAARDGCYNFKPALTIAGAQNQEGLWFDSFDHFETMNLNRKRGPATLHQLHALLEYGWGKDHPIVWRTSELLQALLWEDPSVDLRELKGYCGADPAPELYFRKHLSWRAFALLLRGGFADDAGVRHKAAERLAELSEHYGGKGVDGVRSVVEKGEHTRMIEVDGEEVPEICSVVNSEVPLPDYSTLLFLAYDTESLADPRGAALAKDLVGYLMDRPVPVAQVVKVADKVLDRPVDFLLRSFDREACGEQKLLGRLLFDLELMARLGVLPQFPEAVSQLEWLIDSADDDGVIRDDSMIDKTVNRIDYPYYPLEENWRGKHKKYTDVTFRLLLILRLLDDAQDGE